MVLANFMKINFVKSLQSFIMLGILLYRFRKQNMENQLYCDSHFPTPKGKGEEKIRKASVSLIYNYCCFFFFFNLIALRKAKIVYNFGLSECNRVKHTQNRRLIGWMDEL